LSSKKAKLEVIVTADDQTSSSHLEYEMWVRYDKEEDKEVIEAGMELTYKQIQYSQYKQFSTIGSIFINLGHM